MFAWDYSQGLVLSVPTEVSLSFPVVLGWVLGGSFCDEPLERFDYAWKFTLGTGAVLFVLLFTFPSNEGRVCLFHKEKDQTLDVLVYR